jgi:hypothetical protein
VRFAVSHHLRLWSFVVIACLAPWTTLAQQPAPSQKSAVAPEHASDAGLLLGLYFPNIANWDDLQRTGVDSKWVPEISKEPHGKYLTFWISRSAGTAKIQSVEGLLVPRAAGFWHVGTQIVKSDENEDSSYDEQFWALPADRKPQPPPLDPAVDGTSVRLITYAGSEYLSYIFHWQGGAGAWEYIYPHVVSLDDLPKDVTLEKVLGPAANAGYKRLAKSLDHMNDEPKEGEDREPCNCCSANENEWGILHVGDSWQVFARFHYGTSSSCSQGSEDRVLKTAIPKSIAAGGSLGTPWKDLRAEAEAALKGEPESVRHLFVSPKLDLAVAVGTTGLAVLGVENLHIKSVLKTRAFDKACIPVMEQWSLGRFVAGWDAVIQKEPPGAVPVSENP